MHPLTLHARRAFEPRDSERAGSGKDCSLEVSGSFFRKAGRMVGDGLRVTVADLSLLEGIESGRKSSGEQGALGDQCLGGSFGKPECTREFGHEFAMSDGCGIPSTRAV